MGQAPLPPLKASQQPPVSADEALKIERAEKSSLVTKLLVEDLEVTSLVIKGLLDSQDPKKVCGLMKAGFELKIAEMRDAHAQLQAELSAKVEGGQMQQTEMLMRISNSDGKIRSMQWFLSNIS